MGPGARCGPRGEGLRGAGSVSELEAKEEEELGLFGAGAVAGASGAVATRLRCCLDLLLSLLRCEDLADPEYVLQCALLLLQKVGSLEVGVGASALRELKSTVLEQQQRQQQQQQQQPEEQQQGKEEREAAAFEETDFCVTPSSSSSPSSLSSCLSS